MLAGGGKLPPAIFARFLELAGGAPAKVVLVPTASETADSDDENADTLRLYHERLPGAEITLLHTRDRAIADTESFCAPLRAANGVWFTGGAQDRLAAAYLGTRFESEVMAVLARGGVVGGTSAGTAIQTRTMIQEGRDPPVMATGFDCVPGAISDQHFLKRHRLPRLLQALGMRPGHFGLGVDEGTAAVVRGDELEVVGASKVVLVLPAHNAHAEVVREIAAGARAWLPSWRHAAHVRSSWELPTAFAAPRVASGTLLLGGSANQLATSERFVQLAGGADAKVIVFHAAPDPLASPFDESFVHLLQQLGATNVHRVEAGPGRLVAALSPPDLAVLRDARAVWFDHTVPADDATADALRSLLARGGVVGAGMTSWSIPFGDLSIANGTPDPDLAYERGLGLLPGCAVVTDTDQRDRLRGLWQRIPTLIGIALSQDAVAVVRGSEVEAIGASPVLIHATHTGSMRLDPIVVEPGARYDLVTGARR